MGTCRKTGWFGLENRGEREQLITRSEINILFFEGGYKRQENNNNGWSNIQCGCIDRRNNWEYKKNILQK